MTNHCEHGRQTGKCCDCDMLKLEAEIAELHTTMMAAAVEIQEQWEHHCDAEGYGPANLMHRLERGIAAKYGYDAKTMVRMDKRIEELEAELLNQARVNGMGSEREAKLLTENTALRNENAKLYGWVNDLSQKSIRERNLEAEVARLNAALKSEQDRTTHIGTHAPGCETWGPRHYDCLLVKYAALEAENAKLRSFAQEYIEAWNDGMAGDSYLLRIARAALGEMK